MSWSYSWAIYTDGGIKSSENLFKFFKVLWQICHNPYDPKTKLQEFCLKFKILPKYTFFKKSGPQHKPSFKTEVQIPDQKK